MKVYVVDYIGSDDVGCLVAFSNKKDAIKKAKVLKKQGAKQVFPGYDEPIFFSNGIRGIIEAIEYGSRMVHK